jgi:hypothetical protein
MWLEAASFDFEIAVNMYFTAGGSSDNQHTGATPATANSVQDELQYEEKIRAPDESKKMIIQPNETLVTSPNAGKRVQAASVFAVSRTFKPKTTTEQTLANLFKRPTNIMFSGNFQELRNAGKVII